MQKLFGVGTYDGDTSTQREIKTETGRKVIWRCHYYSKWVDMLRRCYSERAKKKNPTYEKVFVCDEWLIFSNFKAWMINQEAVFGSITGKELDKDIIGDGVLYSENNCCFISRKVNLFFSYQRLKKESKLPAGVIKHTNSVGRIYYVAKIQHPVGYKNLIKAKRISLKYCRTPEEAHFIWAKEKLKIAEFVIADCGNDKIINAVRDKLAILISDAENEFNKIKG